MICPRSGVLEVQWSQALSLVCEVALGDRHWNVGLNFSLLCDPKVKTLKSWAVDDTTKSIVYQTKNGWNRAPTRVADEKSLLVESSHLVGWNTWPSARSDSKSRPGSNVGWNSSDIMQTRWTSDEPALSTDEKESPWRMKDEFEMKSKYKMDERRWTYFVEIAVYWMGEGFPGFSCVCALCRSL